MQVDFRRSKTVSSYVKYTVFVLNGQQHAKDVTEQYIYIILYSTQIIHQRHGIILQKASLLAGKIHKDDLLSLQPC